MRTRALAPLLSCLLAIFGCRSAHAVDCDGESGTTRSQACSSQAIIDEADQQLNALYKDLLIRINVPPHEEERRLFVQAQRAWLSYRDATCNFEQEWIGGIHSISKLRCLARLYEERLAYLAKVKEWYP